MVSVHTFHSFRAFLVVCFILLTISVTFALYSQQQGGSATGNAIGSLMSDSAHQAVCNLASTQQNCNSNGCVWQDNHCTSRQSASQAQQAQQTPASTLEQSPPIILTCPEQVWRPDGSFVCTLIFNNRGELHYDKTDRFWVAWQISPNDPPEIRGINSLNPSFDYELIKDGNLRVFTFWPRRDDVVLRPRSTFLNVTFSVPIARRENRVTINAGISRDLPHYDQIVEKEVSISG
ncbi:hypothetical protein HYV86_00415 [Candidatus Woesearchaeota archaeon]|nr:hypothetical protein [Candidatus Woesearchaeota archaeon]